MMTIIIININIILYFNFRGRDLTYVTVLCDEADIENTSDMKSWEYYSSVPQHFYYYHFRLWWIEPSFTTISVGRLFRIF